MGEMIKNGNGGITVDWPDGLNCYSFAAKCVNPGGAGPVACLPGAKAGTPVTTANITKSSLYQACVADGFEDVSGGVIGSDYKLKHPPTCPQGKYLIAVFFDTRNSFHFARQLSDGTPKSLQWVHKPSAPQNAHNMQNAWYLGTDISNVPWRPPFEFVGYLMAPQAGVTVNRGTFIV